MRMWMAVVVALAWSPMTLAWAQGGTLASQGGSQTDSLEQEAPPHDQSLESERVVELGTLAERFRTQSTEFGPVGGLHVVDAGGGAPGTFRLQLALSYFSLNDFLETGDGAGQTTGALSLSVTPMEHLEVFGALLNRATYNATSDPVLLQVLGDVVLGAKGYYALLPWLTVGGDLTLTMLNGVGDLGLRLDGTNVGLRGNVSADLRHLDDPLPLVLRGNLGYVFDNSGSLIEDTEKARADAFGEFEEEVFVSRAERFGLGINRVDHVGIGLGVEVPLQVADDFFVHPLAEYRLNVAVNRQGYSCLVVATSAGVGERDGCLALQGLAAMPSTLTLGARAFTPVPGLSALLALDVGLSGTGTFVRELAPNAPYRLHFALGYAIEPFAEPEVEQVEVIQQVQKAPPPEARIDGVVVEQGTDQSVAGAIVRYVGLDLTAQATDDDGRFVSYGLPQGPVQLQVEHPDYEPGSCQATMPAPGMAYVPAQQPPVAPAAPAPPSAGASIQPLGPVDAQGKPLNVDGAIDAPAGTGSNGIKTGTQVELGANAGIGATTAQEATAPPAAGTPAAPLQRPVVPQRAPEGGARVPLRCELVAKPKLGSLSGTVVDSDGKPVSGVTVALSGPTQKTATTDAAGAFNLAELTAGAYTARVDAAEYMLKVVSVTVEPSATATVKVELSEKPKTSQVQMSSGEVKIRRQIMFKTNSAEISERSHGLLREIADVLLRNPQVERVEIQGHTDNRGDAAVNRQLSQLRAEAVRNFLIVEGVAPERLEAKGYGDTRPLVPNLTDTNRARNRRVQFMIRKRSAP